MGWKSLVYFEVVTTIALVIGLAAINLTGAGKGITIPQELLKELPRSSERQLQTKVITVLDSAGVQIPEGLLNKLPDAPPKGWQDHIIDIFPENIIKSIYEGNVLPIVFFSVIFGISLALLNEKKKKPMLDFAESLAETMFKFTNRYIKEPGNASYYIISRINSFYTLGVITCCHLGGKNSHQKIYPGDQGAGVYCLCHHQFRFCFTKSPGEYGEIRCAKKNRFVCNTYRLHI